MAQYHWMVRLVQLAAGIFVLLGCLMVLSIPLLFAAGGQGS